MTEKHHLKLSLFTYFLNLQPISLLFLLEAVLVTSAGSLAAVTVTKRPYNNCLDLGESQFIFRFEAVSHRCLNYCKFNFVSRLFHKVSYGKPLQKSTSPQQNIFLSIYPLLFKHVFSYNYFRLNIYTMNIFGLSRR